MSALTLQPIDCHPGCPGVLCVSWEVFVSTDNKMHAGLLLMADAADMSNKVFFWKGRLVSVTSVLCYCDLSLP